MGGVPLKDHCVSDQTTEPNQRQNLLDHETGQTGALCLNQSSFENSSTPRQNSVNSAWDGPDQTNGMRTQVMQSSDEQLPVVVLTQSPNTPPTPQPPTPPPLPINPNLLGGGTVGTVQFSGTRSNDSELTSTSSNLDEAYNSEAPDPSFGECPSGHERKNLMDEISSVGQSVLRRTSRARSPGGTPIKASKNRLTLTGNTDMLQRALISKFRSLHSTPIQNAPTDHDQEHGESFDFSNTWSDINNSAAFDDPDLTTISNSGFASTQCESSAVTPECHKTVDKTSAVCSPNTSMAV